MRAANAIVLVVDRLGAGYAGPYGNTWIDTPELNGLASRGWLGEFALLDTPRVDRLYRSYWTGRHAACPDPAGDRPFSLVSALGEAGVRCSLLTDEPGVAFHDLARPFPEHRLIDPPEATGAAADASRTQMAELFGAAIDWIARPHEPFLLWMHARGMNGPWDAPAEFRHRFVDEEDPPPPAFVDVPNEPFAAGSDPDRLLGLASAYAGQVALLDSCLGALLDAFDQSPLAENTLLLLTSSRGFPLGEHGHVGAGGDSLFGEVLHVPWIVRSPDATGAMGRSHTLIQPPDLPATLLDWFGLAPDAALTGTSVLPFIAGQETRPREVAVAKDGDRWAIRTPAWHFCRDAPPDSQPQPAQLYAKPDDRWEVNDVADRCPEVVEQLDQLLKAAQDAAEEGDPNNLPPLAEVLRVGLD